MERRDPLMKKKMKEVMEKELKLKAENDEKVENDESYGDESNNLEAPADHSETDEEGSDLN